MTDDPLADVFPETVDAPLPSMTCGCPLNHGHLVNCNPRLMPNPLDRRWKPLAWRVG